MRFLFYKALGGLLAFDVLGFYHDFPRLHRAVRGWPISKQPFPPDAIENICHAVNRACIWYPKRALCLQRSLVTVYLLRRCGVAATLVLGARGLPFQAHAWVEVGGLAVNERSDPYSTFGVFERC
jgi:hypothetical protein